MIFLGILVIRESFRNKRISSIQNILGFPLDGNPLQYSCLGKSMDRERSLVGYCPWGSQRFRHDLATKQQQKLVAQRLKRLPAMRETRVRSLNWEDPLEKEMATCSSILAWRIPWTEEPGRLQSTGAAKIQTRPWNISNFIF